MDIKDWRASLPYGRNPCSEPVALPTCGYILNAAGPLKSGRTCSQLASPFYTLSVLREPKGLQRRGVTAADRLGRITLTEQIQSFES